MMTSVSPKHCKNTSSFLDCGTTYEIYIPLVVTVSKDLSVKSVPRLKIEMEISYSLIENSLADLAFENLSLFIR